VPEIVIGSDADAVHVFHIDGSQMLNSPVAVNGDVEGTATVADLDQDGNLEIVIGTNSELDVIDIKDVASVNEVWNTARGNYLRNGAYLYGYVVSTTPESFLPTTLALEQNYPNPFNPTTKIRFGIPQTGNVELVIYDVLGQEVATLVNSVYNKGWYELQWSGLTNAGTQAETGIYFARITNADAEQVVKMMLLK